MEPRDTAPLWQECLSQHLIGVGFERVKSNSRSFYDKSRNLRVLVHGDDYATVCAIADLRWMKLQLDKKCSTKATFVGHSNDKDVVKEGNILNRIIGACPSGLEYE